MKNTLSIFPNGIDSRIFFSDISIEFTDLMRRYQELIKQELYSDASKLLNNSDVFFYGAWLFHLFDNRLLKIEPALLNLEKPKLTTYQPNEPTDNLSGNMSWIGD